MLSTEEISNASNTLPEKHPVSRARQRYGVELSVRDLRDGEWRIRNGLSRYEGIVDGSEVHEVEIQGQLFRACCAPKSKIITTFLPMIGRDALRGLKNVLQPERSR